MWRLFRSQMRHGLARARVHGQTRSAFAKEVTPPPLQGLHYVVTNGTLVDGECLGRASRIATEGALVTKAHSDVAVGQTTAGEIIYVRNHKTRLR